MDKNRIGEEKKKLDINKGFTPIPVRVLNGILAASLTELEIRILLLVCRLSYGCRCHWATFILKDMLAIGIAENHASEIVNKLIRAGWLLRNPFNRYEYRVNDDLLGEESNIMERHSETTKLSSLIGKNLFKETSSNSKEKTPDNGRKHFLNTEVDTSRKRIPNSFTLASSIDSDSKYKDIDRDIEVGTSSKEGLFPKATLDPRNFEVKTEDDEKAIATWKAIEPNNSNSFGFYYYAIVRKKVPHDVIDELVLEIKSKSYLENPGRYFVTQIKKYLADEEELL